MSVDVVSAGGAFPEPRAQEGVVPRDYLPDQDAELNVWVANFRDRLDLLSDQIGLSAGERAAVEAKMSLWSAAFESSRAAGEAARAAVAMKRTARRQLSSGLRPVVRRVQAHPGTDDALRGALRITLVDTPRRGAKLVVPDIAPLLLLKFGVRGQITAHFGPNPGNENRNGLPEGVRGAVVQVRGATPEEVAEARSVVVPSLGDVSETPPPPPVWQLVGNATSSPFVHVVPTAEVRVLAYRVAYVYSRSRRGPWSATSVAAVTP